MRRVRCIIAGGRRALASAAEELGRPWVQMEEEQGLRYSTCRKAHLGATPIQLFRVDSEWLHIIMA